MVLVREGEYAGKNKVDSVKLYQSNGAGITNNTSLVQEIRVGFVSIF